MLLYHSGKGTIAVAIAVKLLSSRIEWGLVSNNMKMDWLVSVPGYRQGRARSLTVAGSLC